MAAGLSAAVTRRLAPLNNETWKEADDLFVDRLGFETRSSELDRTSISGRYFYALRYGFMLVSPSRGRACGTDAVGRNASSEPPQEGSMLRPSFELPTRICSACTVLNLHAELRLAAQTKRVTTCAG